MYTGRHTISPQFWESEFCLVAAPPNRGFPTAVMGDAGMTLWSTARGGDTHWSTAGGGDTLRPHSHAVAETASLVPINRQKDFYTKETTPRRGLMFATNQGGGQRLLPASPSSALTMPPAGRGWQCVAGF